MAFTPFETSTTNISTLSDRPNQNDGLSSAQLKGRFDKAGNDIKTYLNDVLLEELKRTTDGDSGADNIGATAVGDGTATTVQGILEELDADVTALDGTAVHKTGNETIEDTKTFTASPIVPMPTAGEHAVCRDYIESITSTSLSETTPGKLLDATMGKELWDGLISRTAFATEDRNAIWSDLNEHRGETDNPHEVTATQVGALPTTDAGSLPSLTTTEKGSLVGAINEVDGHSDTNATSIGTLASLTTTEKTNLVGAINELDTDKVETSAITNTLTETGTGKVLDARQGKTLSDKIGNQTYTEKNYIADGESATSSINKLDMQLKDTADLVSTNAGNISTNTTFRTKLETYMGNFIEDFLPYGVSWDKGETPTLTRTDFAEGMTAAIGIDDQVVTNNFDMAPIYREIHDVVDTLGNVFVRIPKFYIKKTDGVGSKTWSISKYKHDGYYLPWCFWDFTNSTELPYIDVGKYNASLNGTKLASVANTYPLISKNIVDFRGYAQANNAGGLLGYQQLDVHVIDVLRTLFFIEFATLNSQAIMTGYTEGQYTATHLATATEAGTNRIVVANSHADLYRVGQVISVGTTQGGNQKFYGRTITGITVVDESNKAVEFDGDPVDIATGNLLYNTGWKSGFSSNIVASSGCIVANDGKYPCSYRGIENPFGSVWQFVDGVNITDNQAWVCKDAGQYASNVFASPYEKLSYVNLNASGYGPVEMGYDTDLPFAEFATSVTGGSVTKHYCDYYYQASGSRIALFGGSWSFGLGAGLSCWALSDSSSRTGIAVGGRLLKKPL